ncbi:MAG TPA: NADP oxidoreductase [Marinilabiliales bacterium]|nr:NADP oxidoreductase [Marinilabiliales bacterium]
MKVAIIGTGGVGQTIASKLISLGHQVMIGTRNVAEKLASQAKDGYGNPPFSEWHQQNQQIKLGTFAESAAFGELVINATQGINSINALQLAGANNLNGKILIDIANPLDFSKGMPPGLLSGLSNTHSLGEEIQQAFPEVKVVKTLNTMWAGLMVNPALISHGDHSNFICGNDQEAKQKVKLLLNEFGWKDENILDLGDISASRGTEAILPIWLRIMGAKQSAAFNFKVVS